MVSLNYRLSCTEFRYKRLVSGLFGLTPNDGKINFIVLSNLTSFFDEIMVKPL